MLIFILVCLGVLSSTIWMQKAIKDGPQEIPELPPVVEEGPREVSLWFKVLIGTPIVICAIISLFTAPWVSLLIFFLFLL